MDVVILSSTFSTDSIHFRALLFLFSTSCEVDLIVLVAWIMLSLFFLLPYTAPVDSVLLHGRVWIHFSNKDPLFYQHSHNSCTLVSFPPSSPIFSRFFKSKRIFWRISPSKLSTFLCPLKLYGHANYLFEFASIIILQPFWYSVNKVYKMKFFLELSPFIFSRGTSQVTIKAL